MRIFLDVTRLVRRQYMPTMTGIDRVETALAQWLCTAPEAAKWECQFILTTPIGHAALSRDAMRQRLSDIAMRRNAATGRHEGTGLFAKVARYLATNPQRDDRRGAMRFHGAVKSAKGSLRWLQAETAMIWLTIKARVSIARLLAEPSTGKTHYLHSSHLRLTHPSSFAWTRDPRIFTTFFVHDLIPIDFPEFCGPGSPAEHLVRMSTVAMHADLVITNSHYTAERLRAHLGERNCHVPPVAVQWLGHDMTYFDQLDQNASRHMAATTEPIPKPWPYFLCIGTIEGRKNLLFLLTLWKQMIEDSCDGAHGDPIPRLVLVGKRGWRCAEVLDMLDSDDLLAPYLVEIADLSDMEMQALLGGANALLTPSSAEGFSLPPVEAIMQGVTVIASDIPAHREILGGNAILLDPSDMDGWIAAIRKKERVANMQKSDVTYPQWDEFSSNIMNIIRNAAI